MFPCGPSEQLQARKDARNIVIFHPFWEKIIQDILISKVGRETDANPQLPRVLRYGTSSVSQDSLVDSTEDESGVLRSYLLLVESLLPEGSSYSATQQCIER